MALTSKTAVSILVLATRTTLPRNRSHLLARNRMTTTSFSTYNAKTSLRKVMQRFSPATYLKKWMILNAAKLAFPKTDPMLCQPLVDDPKSRTCMIRGLIFGRSSKSTIEDMPGRTRVTHLRLYPPEAASRLVYRELKNIPKAAGYQVSNKCEFT